MPIADLLDQKLMIEWLYASIRRNIKRGRIFDLREVLATGKADCLGYAKLLTVLGRHCGLDLGVVEVIVDTRGIIVPHTATLVRLADGKPQIVDFWYGSTDSWHQRLGLSVRREGSEGNQPIYRGQPVAEKRRLYESGRTIHSGGCPLSRECPHLL